MTSTFTRLASSTLLSHADRHVFNVVTLLVAGLLVAFLAETELSRARRGPGEPISRAWTIAIAPLTVVFFGILVVRFVRLT
jgi:hypothetical protein